MERQKIITVLLCLLIFSVTFGIYVGTLNNGFIPEWDDGEYVVNNNFVTSGLGVESIQYAFTAVVADNWHPLSIISHMVDVALFGMNPRYHHLTSILIHGVNSVLVFLFLNRTTRNMLAAISVALIFGIHPLHVESVAWIAERKDVLSSFFILLAIYCYARYASLADSANRKILLILICLLHLLGLLSKSMVITFPLFLLLLDYWPLDRFAKSGVKALLREKIPLFAFSIIFVSITLVTQKHKAFDAMNNIEIAAYAYCKQVVSFIAPYKLAYLYSSANRPPEYVLVICLLAFLCTLYGLYKFRANKCVMSGALIYITLYLPVCGIVSLGRHLYSDRYLYLPMLGLCIILVYGVFSKYKKLLFVLPVFLVLLGIATLTYEKTWQSFYSLNKNALDVGSLAGKDYLWANSVLAKQYYQSNEYAYAKLYLKRVLIKDAQTAPGSGDSLASAAFYTLNEYSQMLLEADFMSVLINSYMSLADIYLREGDYRNAMLVIDRGLAFQPNNTFLMAQKNNLKVIDF